MCVYIHMTLHGMYVYANIWIHGGLNFRIALGRCCVVFQLLLHSCICLRFLAHKILEAIEANSTLEGCQTTSVGTFVWNLARNRLIWTLTHWLAEYACSCILLGIRHRVKHDDLIQNFVCGMQTWTYSGIGAWLPCTTENWWKLCKSTEEKSTWWRSSYRRRRRKPSALAP